MAQLKQSDINHLLGVGGVAGECETQDHLRDELLRRIQHSLDAPSGIFFRFSKERTRSQFFDGFYRGLPDDGPEAWANGYRQHDPFVAGFFEQLEAGGQPVVVSNHMVRVRDFERSEFYCDFLKPQDVYHVLVAGTLRNGRPTGILGLHRPRGAPAFSENDVLKMNLLLPHLNAAVEHVSVSQLVQKQRSAIDLLADDLAHPAVLMLDEKFSAVFANKQALHALGQESRNTLNPGDLPPEIGRACGMLCANGLDAECLEFEFELFGVVMHAKARLARAGRPSQGFLISFGSQKCSGISQAMADEFGLSGRQLEIVELVSMGLTNAEIAYKLDISVRTVENHLRAIYGKVRVRNRTTLVSKLSHGAPRRPT